MRFSIVINQPKCLQFELNCNQGALMDVLNQVASWATERVISGKTYWHVSRNKVIDEIPLFYSKPDTVYRAFKALDEKGMIEYLQQNRKDFVRLTARGKLWNKLGNKSEFGNESEQLGNESEFGDLHNSTEKQSIKPTFSEIVPTDNINNNTNDKREANALDFLSTNYATRFEAFCMQHKSKLGSDWQAFVDDYNCKVIEEKLDWDADVLFARLTRLSNNWQRHPSAAGGKKEVTPVVNNPSGQKIEFKKRN